MSPKWTRFASTSRWWRRQRPRDPDLRGFEWHYLRRLCDAATPTLRGHTGIVLGLAFSPDGRRVVSAGYTDGSIKTWDVGSAG